MTILRQSVVSTRLRWTRVLLLGCLGSAACGDLVGNAELPAGTKSPDTYNTPDGALAMYRGVMASIKEMNVVISTSGALTDELTSAELGTNSGSIGAIGTPVDERLHADGGEGYGALQRVRGGAIEARGFLATYAPTTSPALRGEMYALQGYAEVVLGELYCSGVPLSTLDFHGDFTYQPSSTQTEVYEHALALFDSALAISSDSSQVMWLARVAKGRALLDLARYTEAAAAVAAVPDTFQYQIQIPPRREQSYILNGYAVATSEGINGLPFITANDPRVQVTAGGVNQFGATLFYPAKYPIDATTVALVAASGMEARLIEAETALHDHPTDLMWLTLLNTLRTTCTDAGSCPTPAPAGTGGVAGLPPLTDPGRINGNDSARVTLLFAERAYWLFLTGHRQGDLRRLVRNYGRLQNKVYPTGVYFGGSGFYGSDVNLPIPDAELANPYFHGCLDRSE